MSTKAATAPMCKLCQHAHWSNEPHAWTGGNTATPASRPRPPTSPKSVKVPEKIVPIGKVTVANTIPLEIWRDRALAAEAELAEIRRKQAERQANLREKRKDKEKTG